MRQALARMFLVGALAALACPARAQSLAPMDEQVIVKVHHANQMEMQAGQMAQQKATDPEVKRFGALLVRDHRKGDQLITKLAEQKGLEAIPAPKADTPAEQEQMQKQQRMMQHIQQVPAQEFDTAFVRAMVQTHEQAVDMVSHAVRQVKDADLRDTLNELLPILKQHLEIAERLSGAASTTHR